MKLSEIAEHIGGIVEGNGDAEITAVAGLKEASVGDISFLANPPRRCCGKVATFKITKYLDYKKPGKYGDAKGKTFRTMIVDQLENTKVPEKTLAIINSLEKGDAVELSWNHDYVTENGSSYPVRTITKLVKVKEEAPKTEEE